MTEEHPIPTDPELDAILRPERTIPRATGVDRAALWGRLAVAIPALELPTSPASPVSTSAAVSASPPLAAAKAVVVKIGLAAFVGGVTAGIALDRAVLLREAPPAVTAGVSTGAPEATPSGVPALASPPVVATVSEPGAASPSALAAPAAEARAPAVARARAPLSPPVVSPPVVSPPVVSPAAAAASPTPATPSTLGEERELIDVAAAALGAGQLDAVRSALSRHHQRFPSGALAEEREGLSVLLALAEVGWGPAVEAQYTRFARAFPQSPLLLRVQAARARALKKAPTDSPASPQ
jgi:hypothetical protein